MSEHPYPLHIQVAVAKTIAKQTPFLPDWHDLPQHTRNNFMAKSDAALTDLWGASRVVDVDGLPGDAVYMNDLGGIGFVGEARDTCEVDRMEHILHWGGRDE